MIKLYIKIAEQGSNRMNENDINTRALILL